MGLVAALEGGLDLKKKIGCDWKEMDRKRMFETI